MDNSERREIVNLFPFCVILTHKHGAGVAVVVSKDSLVFARTLGKTAENLSNLFQFSCNAVSLHPTSIKNFFVGTGPGSFTGLRLGCAFANGIHLAAKSAQLFSVSTQYNPKDTSEYVSFDDLFHALNQIFENNFVACDSLMPNYSKEPSPVLNLRKEQ